jgi:subtilase family serine protease
MSARPWNALVPPGYTVSSGGGFSQLFPRPAYQDGVPGIGATRGVPDVAADAANDTGIAMAISNGGQHYSLIGTNGTSAPQGEKRVTSANEHDRAGQTGKSPMTSS